eukprot:5461800-Amphidinium_carterae.1
MSLGSLLWFAQRSQPDLSYPHAAASFALCRDLKETHSLIKHMYQHLTAVPHVAIRFEPHMVPDTLHVYFDASFACTG